MLKIIFCILSLLTTTTLSMQAQDTLYFDKDWKETVKGRHSYYRPLPMKKLGELLLLRDYYRTGQLQMQGYIRADNPEVYIGDTYWYDEDGFDTDRHQSRNNSSVKELTYYYANGSLWQKINYSPKGEKEKITTYLNGRELTAGHISSDKKFSGTFNYAQPMVHYERNDDEQEEIATTVVAPETNPKKRGSKASDFYFIIVFWDNGNKASETKVEYAPYSSTTEVYKKFWDKEGKLISERQYKNEEPTSAYLRQEYYTKNYLATSLLETTSYKNGEKQGFSVVYAENGDTLYRSRFEQGELEEINIYQDNRLIQKNTYRENQPYDGVFKEETGGVIKEFKLHEGIKIGKAFLKEIESSEIRAEGEYKNGKPWDGTFFNEADLYEILRFKNGMQDGIQRIYTNLYFDTLKEEYEMKNGVREGYRKIYEADSLVGESLYKNGQIVSGFLQEENTQLTYVDGKLKTRVQLSDRYDNRPITKEEFDNNQLQSITYFDFTIAENPKASYTGYFKNQKPFEGFFKLDTLIDEIALIDYFENGILKYKYSFEFIDQLENYNHYTYTQKTSYSGDRILSGPLYRRVGRERLLRIDYNDSKVTGFDVNLFAMHFFTRMSFKLENDILLISEVNSPLSIKIYAKNERIVADLYEEGRLLKKGEELRKTIEGSPNSRTFYYLDNNKINTFSLSILPFLADNMDANNLISSFYPIFPLQKTRDLEALLLELLSKFESEDFEKALESSIGENYPFQMADVVSFVDFDEKGQIAFGIRPKMESNGYILVEGIENGKVKKKLSFKNLAEMLADDKATLRKFEHQLLNDFD